jgi:hypothetical protein
VTVASFALLFVAATQAPASAPPDAATLLQRSIEAERTNRDRAYSYVWQEQIVHRTFSPPGRLAERTSSAYEVLILEGEPYHRLVSRNGEPLSEAEEAGEREKMQQVAEFRRKTPMEERRKRWIAAEGQRLTFTYGLLTRHFRLAVNGEEELGGRRTWILQATPDNAPKPRNRKQWVYVLACKLWIDQETLLPIRMELTQTKDWENIPAGTQTDIRFTLVDDVWLASRIYSRQQLERAGVGQVQETEQTYSNFRKFAADSVIRFQPPD